MNPPAPDTAAKPPSPRVPLASRWARAGAGPLTARLGQIESALAHPERKPDPLAVWRGTLAEGAAIGRDGKPRPYLTTKYRDELTYWRRVADGAEPSFDGDFHEVFGRWQRTRLYELAGRLGLDRPFAPGKPIAGEVVRLEPRPELPAVCDVHVELDARPTTPEASRGGPPQVATESYRRGWDAIYKRRKKALLS